MATSAFERLRQQQQSGSSAGTQTASIPTATPTPEVTMSAFERLRQSGSPTATPAPAPVEDKVSFGYTGDTKWVYPEIHDPLREKPEERVIKDITEQYDNCDVLLVHLGSLIDKNNKGEK